MLNQEDRNQFIMANYKQLRRICQNSVNFLCRRFPGLDPKEMLSFAFEGLIGAIDRLGITDTSIYPYLYRSTYMFILQKAYDALGFKRKRSNSQDEYLMVEMVPTEPKELDKLRESMQPISSEYPEEIENIFTRDTRKWLYSIIRKHRCLESLILRLICHYGDLRRVRAKCHLSYKVFRKTVARLEGIISCIENNQPYEQYLTDIPPDLGKIIIIRVVDRDEEGRGKKYLERIYQLRKQKASEKEQQDKDPGNDET